MLIRLIKAYPLTSGWLGSVAIISIGLYLITGFPFAFITFGIGCLIAVLSHAAASIQ